MAEYKGKYSMDDPMRYRDPAYTQYLIERAREVGEKNDADARAEQKRLEEEAQKAGYAQLGGQIGGMAAGAYGAALIKDAFMGTKTVPGLSEIGSKLGGALGFGGGESLIPASESPAAVAELFGGAGTASEGTSALGTTLSGAPSMASIIPVAGAAGGLALGAKGIKDFWEGDSGTDSVEGLGGRATLGIATGGLSEIARFAGLGGLGDHKSTREYAADNTKELLGMGEEDPWQNYVNGMREQYNTAPTGKAFAGKYDSWGEYVDAGLEADDLTGVYGNMKTYGPQWADLTFDQQKAITQANIDNDNYYSSKGDVKIRDEALGQSLLDSVLNPQTELPPTATELITRPAGLENINNPAAASAIGDILAQSGGVESLPVVGQPVNATPALASALANLGIEDQDKLVAF